MPAQVRIKARSFNLKLERAREHLHAADVEARSWVHDEPYKFIDEADPDPPPEPLGDGFVARRLRIYSYTNVSRRFSVIVGDCLFNLRSALDHLALALAKKHTPKITAKQISSSEFPIMESAAMFKRHKERKIGCMASAAQAIIETLQPYNLAIQFADKLPKNVTIDFREHPLWKLHDLNRIDKHRELTLCMGVTTPTPWNYTLAHCSKQGYIIPRHGRLDPRGSESDAVVLRYSGVPCGKPDHEMGVQLKPPVTPHLRYSGKFVPATPLLQSLYDFVDNSVIQFSKLL